MRTSRLLTALLCTQLWLAGSCGPTESPVQRTGLDVLAQSADAYAQARPDRPLSFPADHGAHPAYRIEWWYLTANLNDQAGQRYGVQWTLFRLAVQPPASTNDVSDTQDNQVYMAHIALTTPGDHLSFQRYARGGGPRGDTRAGVTAEPFSAWLDDWQLHSTGDGWLPLQVRARQDDYSMNLLLQSNSPLVLQGDAGFSAKHADGGGSYYYSHPFLEASGYLTIAGREIPVSGKAWLDREWSSQFLQHGQTGWDWFSLHLDSGEKLMLFQVRDQTGNGGFLQGKLMAADGSSIELDPGKIELLPQKTTPVAGRNLPLHWRVSLPQIDREFELQALVDDQWMDVDFPYWEGAIIVNGDGPGTSGDGYMELTGYPVENPIDQ